MTDNHFHINTPYYSAWQKYGWGEGDWGIGLNKEKVDELAKKNKVLIVSYGKSDQEYTIKATEVQKYPVGEVRNNTKLYVVPKSGLNYRKRPTPDEELKKLVQELSL